MADSESGSNAQQSTAGASGFTQTGHKADIGGDESMAAGVANFQQMLAAHQLKVLTDAQNFTNQVFQNSMVTCDMNAKQTLKAFEIGTDRQWNVDEVAGLVAKLPTDLQALSAIMTQVVAAMATQVNKKTEA